MSKFEYPILSRADIIIILKQSQIAEVKEGDLKNPNPDFVADLYTRLLIHLDALHEYASLILSVESAKSVEKEYKGLKAKLSDGAVQDKSLEPKLVERQGKVEQLDKLRSQLEKERDLKFEESTKEFNNVKMEVESKRRNLEARQKKVEDVVAEVDAITSKMNMVKESGGVKVQELVGRCEEIDQQV
ncbi:hypothetical protein SLEP1_g58373 [Rubroshorea leprosula]|uniref:Kinetochore protein Nuf2 N-terminal domain-containing protein n=1 Tax=Rubroshorea leprosula TaxID=152421 RepID=A0AAV5MQM1_9ROSI|nr:hypothetical protein SLEP1_g58373 [Rubroshorea leprosula]